MQIIILAGGEGTRLRPFTEDVPKPLVRVLGEPVIERLLALLFRGGFREATVCDHYLADKLEKTLGSFSHGIKLEYVREDYPLGTAGCVRNAWNGTDDVLVISGDSVCDFDLEGILRFHKKHRADVTIVSHCVQDPREYGLVNADEKGRVIGFLEKPGYDSCRTDVANTGTYIISASVMERLAKGEKADFATDVFPRLLKENKRLYTVIEDGIWYDIGDIPSLLICQERLLCDEGLDSLIFNKAYPDETAITGAGSVLENGCSLGSGSRAMGALVLSGASIGEGCTLDHCIIGENTTVGRGCTFGRYSAIGNNCVLGSSVIVDPGVRIENGMRIPSGARITGDVTRKVHFGLGFGDYGEAVGIGDRVHSALRLGSAVARALQLESVTLCGSGVSDRTCEALALGLRSEGAAVYFIEKATFGETVFSARQFGTLYAFYVDNGIRLLRSDRLELARSEERRIEQSFDRGELSGNKSAPIISGEAAKKMYSDRIKSILNCDIKADIRLVTENIAEAEKFTELFSSVGGGEKIEFRILSDRMRVVATLSDKNVPYESLLLLGARASFYEGKGVCLPERAPLSCDDYAKREGLSVVRVSSTDSDELSPIAYDPFSLIAIVLSYLSKRSISMSAAVSELPDIVYTRRTFKTEGGIPTLLSKELASLRHGKDIVVESDGAKAFVRPLKSGKALSMYVESVSAEAADSLCDGIISRLNAAKRSFT